MWVVVAAATGDRTNTPITKNQRRIDTTQINTSDFPLWKCTQYHSVTTNASPHESTCKLSLAHTCNWQACETPAMQLKHVSPRTLAKTPPYMLEGILDPWHPGQGADHFPSQWDKGPLWVNPAIPTGSLSPLSVLLSRATDNIRPIQ